MSNANKTVLLPHPAEQIKKLNEQAGYIAQLQQAVVDINIDFTKLKHEMFEVKKHFHEGGFIYVASPYSHKDPAVLEKRYQDVMYYTVGLLRERQWAYSPIVHCHELAKIHQLPTDAQYWLNYNFAMLTAAKALHVLCLPGWQDSIGVAAETAFWRQHSQRPVQFIEV